MQVTMQI